MAEKINDNVNMSEFLGRHKILWDKKPRAWDEGAFVGGGLMGSCLYFSGKNRLTLTVGDTGIYDNRMPTEKERSNLFLTPRLPIGEFHIGGVTGAASMQLDLYTATAYGWSKTLVGTYKYKCFSPHGKRLIIFETINDNTDCRFDWVAADIESPRQRRLTKLKSDRASKDYPPARKPYSYQHRDIFYCIYPLFSGGYYVLAYKFDKTETGVRMFITVGEGSKENLITQQLAYELDSAASHYNAILQEHLSFWRSFYEKSFVSVNDTAIEEFYWIQLYKLASAGCEHGRVYDTCGPWLSPNTAWPGTWWNLNVQLTYSPLFASNHTELVYPLAAALKEGFGELINNVPAEYRYDSAAIGRCSTASLHSPVSYIGDPSATDESGNLLWALHSVMLIYSYTEDKEVLNEIVYPLCKRAVNFYLHFLLKDENCVLHIPATVSPEYPHTGTDTCYDLALLKWGLRTLLEINRSENFHDKDADEWKWVLEHLADYPVDGENGFMIAADVPYSISHRHYSHLLMIYPLHTLDLTKPQNRELALKSIAHWHSKPEALQGYSQTGAASMHACLGDGNTAYRYLSGLWTGGFIRPNTMYHEGGCPVLETPCAAACSVLDMLLQSFGGLINIFPAVPDAWTDITFKDLLCEGGFEATAVMRGGKLLWCMIKNRCSTGGICRIKAPFSEDASPVMLSGGKSVSVPSVREGIKIRIPKDMAIILSDGKVEDFTVEAVATDEKGCHIYGNNKNSIIS